MPISISSSNTTFSVENSTKTSLNANQVWSGKFEDVTQFATIYTLWKTDTPGTLYFDFSMDGTNIVRTISSPTADLIDGNYQSVGPYGRYLRLRYVNGSIPQSLFHLQTTYSSTVADGGRAVVANGVNFKSISTVTRGVSFGLTSRGDYRPIKVENDGSLIINHETLTPVFVTRKLTTSQSSVDQIVLTYTTPKEFQLTTWSIYVWDRMSFAQTFFGEASLESPAGNKLYTSQLTSMGMGKDIISFPKPLVFPMGQTIQIVCSPSEPNNQNWQANLIGLS